MRGLSLGFSSFIFSLIAQKTIALEDNNGYLYNRKSVVNLLLVIK